MTTRRTVCAQCRRGQQRYRSLVGVCNPVPGCGVRVPSTGFVAGLPAVGAGDGADQVGELHWSLQDLGAKSGGGWLVRLPRSLGEEPAQFCVFLHRVPGVLEEGSLRSLGRAVPVLLFGGPGKGGGAGFSLGRFFPWSVVWHVSYSVHRGKIRSAIVARSGVGIMGRDSSIWNVGLPVAHGAGEGGGIER